MTKIKVCGLTREVDIEYVNELKPDYIGFVFAKSKRKISADDALPLRENLNEDIKVVGVFVNESIEEVKEIAKKVRLDVLQFHGEEDLDYMSNFKDYEVWKALSVNCEEDLIGMDKFKDVRILLDSKVEGMLGGTGKAFDWNILKKYNFNNKIILAGGLNTENIESTRNFVHSYAVDVSSGVETDGVKDYNKIKKFIEKVRGL
jgi:phosphoribosylanthranilate isomerase